jgi:hypothetical protein
MDSCYIDLEKSQARGDYQAEQCLSLIDFMIADDYDDKYDLEEDINQVSSKLYDMDICYDNEDVLNLYEPESDKLKGFRDELQNRNDAFDKLAKIPALIDSIVRGGVR